MMTRVVDQMRYFVGVMFVSLIHAFESKGLNVFMKTIANSETKRTMIIWFLFSSRYLGTCLNSGDLYSVIFATDAVLFRASSNAKLLFFFQK